MASSNTSIDSDGATTEPNSKPLTGTNSSANIPQIVPSVRRPTSTTMRRCAFHNLIAVSITSTFCQRSPTNENGYLQVPYFHNPFAEFSCVQTKRQSGLPQDAIVPAEDVFSLIGCSLALVHQTLVQT